MSTFILLINTKVVHLCSLRKFFHSPYIQATSAASLACLQRRLIADWALGVCHEIIAGGSNSAARQRQWGRGSGKPGRATKAGNA